MQNQALKIILTLLMNTASALVGFAAFKQGSVGYIICIVAATAVGNTLALFGTPMVQKPEEPKNASLPGEIVKYAFLPILFAGALLVNGCAFATCELGKLSAVGQVGFATAQKIASEPASTSQDLVSAALQLSPGQLECGAQALLDWLDKSQGRKAGLALAASQDHARSVLRAYLEGKATACRAVKVAVLEPCADSSACREITTDDDVPAWNR